MNQQFRSFMVTGTLAIVALLSLPANVQAYSDNDMPPAMSATPMAWPYVTTWASPYMHTFPPGLVVNYIHGNTPSVVLPVGYRHGYGYGYGSGILYNPYQAVVYSSTYPASPTQWFAPGPQASSYVLVR